MLYQRLLNLTSSLIQDIYEFNSKAGFLDKPMDSFNELSYTLEECFEGFEECYNTLDANGNPFKPGDPYYPTSRQLGLSLANALKEGALKFDVPPLTDVQEVDKSIDIVVYNIGKLAKMGLTVDQIDSMFKVVSEANMAKLDAPVDESGKQTKPSGWVGPEAKLQEILDARQ